jgi:hypothetical protein
LKNFVAREFIIFSSASDVIRVIKKNEMARACSAGGRGHAWVVPKSQVKPACGSPRNKLESNIKVYLKKNRMGRVWTGFSWLWLGFIGWLL